MPAVPVAKQARPLVLCPVILKLRLQGLGVLLVDLQIRSPGVPRVFAKPMFRSAWLRLQSLEQSQGHYP